MITHEQPAFAPRELALASCLALTVQIGLALLVAGAGSTSVRVKAAAEVHPDVVPIAVQPVLDDLPLLKLGTKNPKKKTLPDMWQKRPPVPVRRLEERAAPSESAADDVSKVPTSKVADKNNPAPDEDDELIKETDQKLADEETVAPSELTEEGAEDGSEHGTETDPLKARAVDLYRQKLHAWFTARFRPPTDEVPCEVLRTLSAGVVVQVGSDRAVTGFSISGPSGNAVFDARVTKTLQGIVGQILPPPPPLYPDILGQTVTPRLSGAGVTCSAPPPARSPSAGDESGSDGSGSNESPASPD